MKKGKKPKWDDTLKAMRIGEPFIVPEVRDQRAILMASRRLGLKVSTRKIDRAGYVIKRIV